MATENSDVTKLIATIVNPLEILPKSYQWLQTAEQEVKEVVEAGSFKPEEIQDEDAYKYSKKKRAELNKIIKKIDEGKKDQTGIFKQAIQEFEYRTKNVLSPLLMLEEDYKDRIKDYELAWRQKRAAYLADAAYTMAPDLKDLYGIDYYAIATRFDAEHKWQKRTTSIRDIEDALLKALSTINKEITTIKSLGHEDHETETILFDYAKSLDLSSALSNANERTEQIKARKREEEERKAWIESMQKEAPQKEDEQTQQEETQPAQAQPENFILSIAQENITEQDLSHIVSSIYSTAGVPKFHITTTTEDVKKIGRELKEKGITVEIKRMNFYAH